MTDNHFVLNLHLAVFSLLFASRLRHFRQTEDVIFDCVPKVLRASCVPTGRSAVRFRRLIGFLAMLGVLLHAGFLVRHNSSMLQAVLQHQALAADLGVICHSGGAGIPAVSPDLPPLPQPNDSQRDCPICAGHLAAAAILPLPDQVAAVVPRSIDRLDSTERVIVLRTMAVRPPSRGPPLRA
jgi:hypothetical protein